MATGDREGQPLELAQLADELRAAGIDAVAQGSPLAPTLDDCRVDVERLLTAPPRDDDRFERHAILLRGTLALGTWRRIVAAKANAAAGPPRCPSCSTGVLVEVARAGRVAPFRGVAIELPSDLAIPTCDRCGAESLDAETAARLDALLFRAYVDRR